MCYKTRVCGEMILVTVPCERQSQRELFPLLSLPSSTHIFGHSVNCILLVLHFHPTSQAHGGQALDEHLAPSLKLRAVTLILRLSNPRVILEILDRGIPPVSLVTVPFVPSITRAFRVC
jgi:hypothetical protein